MPGIRLIISGTWNRLSATPINLQAKMIKCSTAEKLNVSSCLRGFNQKLQISLCPLLLNSWFKQVVVVWGGGWDKYRHKNVMFVSKKWQQSQIHLNVLMRSETRLKRGTCLFTLKLCTLAITKPGYPLQVKGFGCLMHSCPLFTAQTTLSKATLHFNSLGVWQAKHMKDGGFF